MGSLAPLAYAATRRLSAVTDDCLGLRLARSCHAEGGSRTDVQWSG